MKTITASAAKDLGHFLAKDFRRIFGSTYDETAERLGSLARSTLECIGRSDALNRKVKIPRGASDAALTASRSRAATFHSKSNRVSGAYLRAFALDMNRPGHRCGGAWPE